MRRAISINEMYATRRKLLPFKGKWLEGIGTPELCGSWSIHGLSGHGKSALAIQVAMVLTEWTRIYYDSLEQGNSYSLAMGFRRQGAERVKRKIIILDKEPIEDVKVRLRKKKSGKVVIVDSTQYTFLRLRDYFDLLLEFGKTHLFIWISHEKNGDPDGALARKIYFDADVKIRVHGYRAFIISRFLDGGTGIPIDVWPEGAAKFYKEF